MKTTAILIVGGYGNTGLNIAKLLLEHTNVHLIIAGRNEEKARSAALQLEETHSKKVSILRLDLADEMAVLAAFEKCDLAIIAAAAVEQAEATAIAAIETRTDYLDTQLSYPEKVSALKKYSKEYEKRGMTVITDGGFHPGVPAALVKYAETKFDRLEKANVSSYMGIRWDKIEASPNTLEDFANELKAFNPTLFRNKVWKKLRFSEMGNIVFDFGGEIGKRNCTPMYLHEMEVLPEMTPSLEETGFFVAGFNWFTDNIVMPITMLTVQIKSKMIARLMGRFIFWSAGKFSKPPYVTVLQLEAEGMKNKIESSLKLTLSHEDAYVFTAAPIVACIIQYLKKEHSPGFYFQSHFVEPGVFLEDMRRLGINISDRVEK